ncbi:MAG: DUF882 domain-containing protein [Oscillospiraceae bacterium]|nr:DUF882 domain-containing protein [Oscillospiraceae bacterium]
MNGAGVRAYSKAKDGAKALSANFKVREFACQDGTDTIFVSAELVSALQKIRDHFGRAVTVNSAYRTEAHNKKVGGAAYSQHKYGTAADIAVQGVTPLEAARYAHALLGNGGGVGLYKTFIHVDVRAAKSRWDQRSGKQVAVSKF